MPARKPKKGDQYRFVGPQPLGAGGALLPETIVTVREFVDAGEIGAYDDQEDSVVIEWEQPGVVVTGMREEPYQRPEVVKNPDGSPATDEYGNVRVELVDRLQAIPQLGYGSNVRAMSIGVVGRDFTDAEGRPATLPPFSDLFEFVAAAPPADDEED